MLAISLFQGNRNSFRIFNFITLTFISIVTLWAGVSYADLNEIDRIIAADGAYNDFFGTSVSISGDFMIVGAKGDDDRGSNSGSVYIFQRSGSEWTEAAKLVAGDGAVTDSFGTAVSISGDYAIVGSPFDSNTYSLSGAAYIFERSGSTWTQASKLLAPADSNGNANDYFGCSVSISGEYAIVGALNDDDSGSNSGSAHVFKRTESGWTHMAELIASDGADGDNFGHSVSISANYVIVGAPKDDGFDHTDSGAVYFFERSGDAWSQAQKIVALLNVEDGDQYGVSVSIDGDMALVGVSYHDDDVIGQDVGYAQIIKRYNDAWVWSAYLQASDPADSDDFGYSVSLSGDYAVIGTLRYSNSQLLPTAFVFKKTSESGDTPLTEWIQSDKLIPSDAEPSSPWGYGSAVSIDGAYGVVGAQYAYGNANSAGAAYIFQIYSSPSPPAVKFNPAIPMLLLDQEEK